MGKEIHLSGLESQEFLSPKLRIGVTGHRNELNDGTSGEVHKRPAPDITAIRAIIREVLILIYDAFKEIILNRIEKYDPKPVGNPQMDLNIISALASGADQWVADEAIKLGFKLEAVLPFNRDEYLRDFSDRMDAESYMFLINHATEITELDGKIWFDETGKRKHEGNTYEISGNEIIMRSDILIAVWDGNDSRGKGGTGQVVKDAKKKRIPVIWIPWSAPEKWRVGLPPYPGNQESDELIGEKDRLMEIIRNLMRPYEMKYHKTLAAYFHGKPLYLDESAIKKPNIRKLVELPWQQTKGEMWDEVTETLCNLDFIQAKATTKMTYELINDFNRVSQVIPDNHENIQEEKTRQARLDKYTNDLILYSKREIEVLEVPESITPWKEKLINVEIERIKTNPNRADKLIDFINFLGQEANSLQKYASEFAYFTHQQAWNYAAKGPVGNEANKLSSANRKLLLRRNTYARPIWRTKPQILQYLTDHKHWVNAVAVTTNGKMALTGSSDLTCILWDLTSGKSLQTLKGHTGGIYSVAITPDGERAISGSADKNCILWDLATGKALLTLIGHTEDVNSVAITPDGRKAISGSSDNTCIIWDLTTGESIHILKGHTFWITSVAITSNGEKALTGSSDKTCILWDLERGEELKKLEKHTNDISSVAITPNGEVGLTGSFDGTCILWDLTTGKTLKTLNGRTRVFHSVSMTPDGKIAISGSRDKDSFENHCTIWNLTTGQDIQTLQGHYDSIKAVSITPDGRKALSVSWDNSCIVWDLTTGKASEIKIVHKSEVSSISIAPVGDVALSGSRDNTCILWDLKTGKVKQTFRGHTAGVSTVLITPEGSRALSGSYDKTCILWDLVSSKPLQTFNNHYDAITGISITSGGVEVVSGSFDKTCRIWKINNGEVLGSLFGHADVVWAVTITPDDKLALVGYNNTSCILWNLISKKALNVLNGHTNSVSSVAITPDGRLGLSGSLDNSCILWDLSSGVVKHKLIGHTSGVSSVAFSSDGGKAFSTSIDKTCIFWDIETGKQLARVVVGSSVKTIATYYDRIILGCSSGEIVFLNIDKNILRFSAAITTIKQIWSFELMQYKELSADCPLCGYRFAPAASVLQTIKKITTESGLKPDQSPCLELPDEAWEDISLLGNCPKCGEKLKFNPFIAGGD